jgi:hypothetical protein
MSLAEKQEIVKNLVEEKLKLEIKLEQLMKKLRPLINSR